jgi:hypothetical protein
MLVSLTSFLIEEYGFIGVQSAGAALGLYGPLWIKPFNFFSLGAFTFFRFRCITAAVGSCC